MDISKKLILTGSVKDAPNLGIFAARNIQIDEHGQYIQNEDGLVPAIDWEGNPKHIVGCIPTPKEIYIFTRDNAIYKLENGSSKPVKLNGSSNWKYIPDTKFVGTYTYLSNGKVCFAVSQYKDTDGDDYYKYPLQTWIDDNNNLYNYNVAPDIPQTYTSYQVSDGGNLLVGVYTFFIRYKIANDDYTNWFQITDDIMIFNKFSKSPIVHNYLYQSTILQADTLDFESFNVNKNGYSPKKIVLNLKFKDNNYDEYQIAYIIKNEGDIRGRIITRLSNSDEITYEVADNNYFDEVSVDDLLKVPHPFFNVRNVWNYNNKLYIGNYCEHKLYDDLKNKVSITTGTDSRTYVTDKDDEIINYDFAVVNFYIMNLGNSGFWHLSKRVKIAKVTNQKSEYYNQYKVVDMDSTDTQSEVNGLIRSIVKMCKFTSPVSGNIIDPTAVEIFDKGENDQGKTKYDRVMYNARLGFKSRNALMLCFLGAIPGADNDDFPTIADTSKNYKGPYYRHSNWLMNNGDWRRATASYANRLHINFYIGQKGNITVRANYSQDVSADQLFFNNPDSIPTGSNGDINAGQGDNAYAEVKLNTQDKYDSPYFDIRIVKHQDVYYNNGAVKYEQISASGEADPNDINNIDTDKWEGITYDKSHHVNFYRCYANAKIKLKNTDDDGKAVGKGSYINNRTLIPHQEYNLFVHFIRKDGTVTDGYEIDDYIMEAEDCYSKSQLYNLSFDLSNNGINSELYVGAFVTYEKIVKNVEWCIMHTVNEDVCYTNAMFIYENKVYHAKNCYSSETKSVKVSITSTIKDDWSRVHHNCVQVTTGANADNKIYYLYNEPSEYLNEYKTLYRLTGNRYFNSLGKDYVDGACMYAPGYYNKEKSIIYDKDLIASRDTQKVCNSDNGETTYKVSMIQDYVYSDVPLDSLVIKEDYEIFATVFTKPNSNDSLGSYTSMVVFPHKVQDFLYMPKAYDTPPDKTYGNYRRGDHVWQFGKTVYRSNQISDESNENRFRHFEADQYKIIAENKGNITNIIGLGYNLIVHTEHGMFMFNNNNQITQDVKVQASDVFDDNYRDMFPNTNGYGGLQDNREAIVCNNGYIWLDKENKVIFQFNDGKVDALSMDINDFIKRINIKSIRFAYTLDNRLLICITYYDDNNVDMDMTLSYSFQTKTFISLHDYTFTRSYNTYNQCYLFDSTKDDTNLYKFDRNKYGYSKLTNTKASYIPMYSENGMPKAYVDVLVNANYGDPKVLEHISYSLYKLNHARGLFETTDRITPYSGDYIILYSDQTYSSLLSLETDPNVVNKLKDYQHPYYDKGRWNFNYFRNNIDTPDKELSIEGQTTIVEYDEKLGKYIAKNVSIASIKRQLSLITTEKSLIYGKYIVARFIFNNDKKIRLESVEFNLNNY